MWLRYEQHLMPHITRTLLSAYLVFKDTETCSPTLHFVVLANHPPTPTSDLDRLSGVQRALFRTCAARVRMTTGQHGLFQSACSSTSSINKPTALAAAGWQSKLLVAKSLFPCRTQSYSRPLACAILSQAFCRPYSSKLSVLFDVLFDKMGLFDIAKIRHMGIHVTLERLRLNVVKTPCARGTR